MHDPGRNHTSSYLWGHLPGSALWGMLYMITLPITIFAAVPDKFWIFGIHF